MAQKIQLKLFEDNSMEQIALFILEYRFLSNFYPSPITYEGIRYPTVEHAFQAAKSLKASDKFCIAALSTPGKAKRAGRGLKLREDWEAVKLNVMKYLLILKFQDKVLKEKLLETKGKELVEGNYWLDYFWGVCAGKGQNHLGKLLMQVRDELSV